MGVLARCSATQLIKHWSQLNLGPVYQTLRAAETGLVMVRGRSGGTGSRFNLGEMTVSRCTVRLDSGETGVSYRAGRDRHAAEISAIADALLQNPEWHARLWDALIVPLQAAQQAQREQTLRRSAATKVDFFTMTR